jgi:hypothetical protein
MDRTTPVSNGWMTLVRPLGTIFPVVAATISIVPAHAQLTATQNSKIIVAPIARPTGDGGVSAISSAAGRNASSFARLLELRRIALMRRRANLATVATRGGVNLTDLMDTRLQPVQ